MLLPRMESESNDVGSRLRAVIFTVFKCVFICMSTPNSEMHSWAYNKTLSEDTCTHQ